MAGHSKWANIKHRKERSDAKKGKIFSKIAKEIITAVKLGGPDPKSNTRLRLAIQLAKDANMPSDNVDKNIKKASSADQAAYDDVTYEFYGYGGVGLVVETSTDNKNRLATEMRIATNKKGGTIASPGSVTFNFDRKGVIQIKKEKIEEDAIFEEALNAGADNFEVADEDYMVTTDPVMLYEVKEALEKKGYKAASASIEWIPKNIIECNDEQKAENMALIEYLEEIESVNSVYHNMDL